MYGNNTAIFITKITSGGVAEQDGRLRPNDILFKVNDINLLEAEHSDAVQALKEAGQVVYLTIKRLHPTLVEDIILEKTQNGLGFSISGGLFTEHIKSDHGIFVTKIIPGGSADLDGKLSVGDRLISVNDFSLEYVTHDDAVAAIASVVEQYNEIILRVGKVTQFTTTTLDEATLKLVEHFFLSIHILFLYKILLIELIFPICLLITYI
jgi:disks large protein 1